MNFLFEPLTFEFMQRALVAAVLMAVTCSLLSCWLILMGWSLMGDAISHAVLPGVVLAYIVGAPFAVGAARGNCALTSFTGAGALSSPRNPKQKAPLPRTCRGS